jgi:hypothetical protein
MLRSKGAVVKRNRWILLVCLAGALLLWALPAIDSAETAFNETEAPVLVSHPELPRVRVTPARLPVTALTETSATRLDPVFLSHSARFSNPSRVRSSTNLQHLLCVLLI